MKTIGIIGAMDVEVRKISTIIDNKETVTISGVNFISGTVGETKVIVAKCGVGKVFAAICSQAMIFNFKPDLIINIGVCGSVSKELKIFDIILGEQTVQWDMDTSPLGDPVGMISDINKIYFECDKEANSKLKKIMEEKEISHKYGTVASADKFVADTKTREYINTQFSALTADMESASIGHVCYVNNTPYTILRAISDNGNEDSTVDFPTFVEKASDITFDVVKEFLS